MTGTFLKITGIGIICLSQLWIQLIFNKPYQQQVLSLNNDKNYSNFTIH